MQYLQKYISVIVLNKNTFHMHKTGTYSHASHYNSPDLDVSDIYLFIKGL